MLKEKVLALNDGEGMSEYTENTRLIIYDELSIRGFPREEFLAFLNTPQDRLIGILYGGVIKGVSADGSLQLRRAHESHGPKAGRRPADGPRVCASADGLQSRP